MKVDISEMLLFFDELLPSTDEELGQYWFKTTRSDRISVTFIFSIYEKSVSVIVRANPKVAAASVDLEHCAEIRVLDHKKKCLEVLQKDNKGRCFLSLLDDSVLDYSERFTVPNAD